MAKECTPLLTDVNTQVFNAFSHNVKISEENCRAVSLKMDETCIKPDLAYNAQDNLVYGVCYQHGKSHNLQLDTYDDCINLQEDVKNNNNNNILKSAFWQE